MTETITYSQPVLVRNPIPSDYNIPHDLWRPHQLESLLWAEGIEKVGVIQAATGCHEAGTLILMFDGSTKCVENIVSDDVLMGPGSKPMRVLSLVWGVGQMYRIDPTKGDSFVVNEDHILSLVRTSKKRRGMIVRSDCKDGQIVDVSVGDYLSWSKTAKHIHKLFRVGVVFPKESSEFPLSPYFLGLLLGDGCFRGGVAVSTPDREIVQEIYRQAKILGLTITTQRKIDNAATDYHLVYKRGCPNAASEALRKLGLFNKHSGDKYVPQMYKTSSRENRMEILAGLIDTDGYLGSNCYDYISKSEQLSSDVVFLCRSLGLAAYMHSCQKSDQYGHVGTYYRVSISGHTNQIPCRVQRKQATKRLQKKNVLRTGFSVVAVGESRYFGFVLDGDGRYLMGDFTVTHNSGKSIIPAGLSTKMRTCSLTRTKSLQQQYALYHGCILMGKSNYPCIHPENEDNATCSDCLYDSMNNCDKKYSCKYLIQRWTAMHHSFPCVNYALWSSNMLFRSVPPEVLVLDECHLASDISLSWAGTVVHDITRVDFGLPQFPIIRGATRDDIDRSLAWLIESRIILQDEFNKLRGILRRDGPDKKVSRRAARVQNLDYSFCATRDALRECPEAWYIRSGPRRGVYRGKVMPGIDIRPLTARYHFPRLFLSDKWKTMLMSATVGDFKTFTEELGINQDDCLMRRVPSNFAPSTRPVYVLDAPKMGYKSTEKDYMRQAQVIAGAIRACPTHWGGIIHVTRIKEASLLRDRLISYGVNEHRLWVLPQQDRHRRWLGTQGQTLAWEEWKRVKPNAIMISWTHWEGFDGLDEKICIVTKTPFPSTPSGSYEEARRRYSHRFYNQRTAWALQQALGRTRRGRDEDYDTKDEVRGMVAIADGNYKMVEKYMDEDFVESLVS